MSKLFPGRYTAQLDGSFVVFIIGLRINKLWAVHKWLPVAQAMGPMLKELLSQSDLGLLHAESYLYWRGVALVQYWRSFDQLDRFAKNPVNTHLQAWKRFNQAVAADGSVGIWHETYQVQAGQYECIYANMPKKGLALAGNHEPVVSAKETARRRMALPDA